LKPFDAILHRGTNHAWINRGTQKAMLIVVLVDSSAGSSNR
jgi:hypothetical protein